MSVAEAGAGTRPPINSLDKLTPFGWAGSLLVILGGLIASFFAFGFWYPFWRIADQDILLVYDALLQNASLPREIVLHPAHLTVLILSRTYRLLHDLGLLDSFSLATLPKANDAAAYNQAWTSLVQIARLTSLATALVYVAAFGFLLRRLIGDWRGAAIGMFAVAYSGGVSMSVRSVKPEMLTASLIAIALLILLLAARSPHMKARPLLLGAAALLGTLALDNKVQAVFLLSAFPLLLLPFGETSPQDGYWPEARAGWTLAAIAAATLLAAAGAMPLVVQGLSADPSVRFVKALSIFGMTGLPEALLAAWIGLGMLAFGLIWRVPVAESLAAALSLIGGVALGLLPLYLSRETSVVALVITPLDSLFGYVSDPTVECVRQGGCNMSFASVLGWLEETLTQHSFFLKTTPRPALFLEWCVIAGAAYAFRRGNYRLTLQVVFLIGAVLAVDTLEAAHALRQDYFQFTDPLIVIAAVLLIAGLPALQQSRWTYPVGALLIALHIAFSQAEPIKHAFKRSGPEENCVFLNNLRRLESFPFCRG
jgi:hypothetical protein